MASDAYLLIDGVNGESQAQGMTNNIELDSFSFGAAIPADVGGSGSVRRQVFVVGLQLLLRRGLRPAIQMLKAIYTGTAHRQHALSPVASRRRRRRLTLTSRSLMTNCYITSNSMGGGASGMPSQSVSIAYEQIEYQYYTQDTSSGAVTLAGAGDVQHRRRAADNKHRGK